jgi:hypothetical protein
MACVFSVSLFAAAAGFLEKVACVYLKKAASSSVALIDSLGGRQI